MKFLGNLIWLIFGGIEIAIEYLGASLLLMLTIVGIPFGLQTIKLALVALWPFGATIEDADFPSGCLAGLMNVIWWIVGGIPVALTHLGFGLLLCITIVGIPWGIQHFKLMRLALFPFGNDVNYN